MTKKLLMADGKFAIRIFPRTFVFLFGGTKVASELSQAQRMQLAFHYAKKGFHTKFEL